MLVLPILVAPAPTVLPSPMSSMVITPELVLLALAALIVKVPSVVDPPITPLRPTAPEPELIVKFWVPSSVEAKSTLPFAVVNVIAPVANVVASLISIFPADVVILPFKVTPPDPSIVTLPISVPIPATPTVPEPASSVTVVVPPPLVPAIAPSIEMFPTVPLPVSTVRSAAVARVIFPSSKAMASLSVAKSGSVPVIE